MNKNAFLTLWIIMVFLTGYAWSEMIVDLNANDLPEGPIRIWPNAGTLGDSFHLADADPDPAHSRPTADPDATVEIVNGKKCVTFTGQQAFEYNTAGYTPPDQLIGNKSFTIAFWVLNPSIDNAEESMGGWARRGDPCGSAAHFNYGNSAGSGAVVHWCYDAGFSGGVPELGQWHHIAYTYDAVTLKEVIYVDGGISVSTVIPAPGFDFKADKPLRIGCAQTWVWPDRNRFFSGSMASVQIYDEALSAREVGLLSGSVGSVNPEELTLTEGGLMSGTITVELFESPDGAPTQDVQVTLAIQNQSPRLQLDGTSAAGASRILTFPAASYTTPQTVNVTLIDDTIIQSAEVIQITASITGGDPKYVGQVMAPNSTSITLIDNERKDNAVPAVYRDGFLIDDYSIARDYLAYGTTDTPYDGLMNTQNAVRKTDANISKPGSVHLESYNANWGENNNSGPFLYKNVSGDFIVETYVSGYAGDSVTPVYHNDCGLMIRNPDTTQGENNLQNSYFPIWTCGNMIRYNVNGGRSEPESENLRNAWNADKYLRIERRGADFYCSHSMNGVNWMAFPSSPFRFPTLNVETLQVGFQQATYTTTTGWAEFDYFKIKLPNGTLSGTMDLYEALESTGELQVALAPPAGYPAPLDDVIVTLTPVAVSGAGADANDIKLGAAEKAQPVTLTFPQGTWDQPQTVTVQAISDDTPEGIQVMSVQYSVSSADPNWNGSMLNNTLTIKVYDGNPGLVLVETNGSTRVYEGGASDTIEIALQSMPSADVTVDITDNDTVNPQVTFTPAQIVFTAANWNQKQTVALTAIDDTLLEGDPHWDSFRITANNGAEYNSTDTVIPETWFQIHDNECGAWGTLWADINSDCIVDISDMAQFFAQWLDCTRPNDPACVDIR